MAISVAGLPALPEDEDELGDFLEHSRSHVRWSCGQPWLDVTPGRKAIVAPIRRTLRRFERRANEEARRQADVIEWESAWISPKFGARHTRSSGERVRHRNLIGDRQRGPDPDDIELVKGSLFCKPVFHDSAPVIPSVTRRRSRCPRSTGAPG
jgi:hypothetical protein